MIYLFYTLNGLSYGMMLFILASGLSLILGVMNILNLAHGAFYMLGFYVALSTAWKTDNYFLSILAGTLAAGVFGLLVQQFLLARIPKQYTPQVLLTFGIILMLENSFRIIWGGEPKLLAKPEFLSTSFPLGGLAFPTYRIALIVIGIVIAILLWLFLEWTKWGAILRAGRDNPDMAQGVGINIPLVWVLVFGFGIMLAGLAGALGGPLWGGYPGADWEVLTPAVVIIVMGGLGSLKGAFIISTLVGLVDNFGKAFFPQFAMFLLFFLLVVILALRPRGLFGRA